MKRLLCLLTSCWIPYTAGLVHVSGTNCFLSFRTPLFLAMVESSKYESKDDGSVRWQQQQTSSDVSPQSITRFFDDGDPSKWLPIVAIVLLAVNNLLQAQRVAEQIAFLEATERAVGGDLGQILVNDVLAGDEFESGLADVVGQTLGEIFLGPVCLTALQLLLNALFARAIGRNIVPLLIIAEAFLSAIGELAGQSLGSSLAETLRPVQQMLLDMLVSGHT